MTRENVASRLAPMTVLDERGTTVTLGECWRDRAALVVFVRHFG